MEREGKGEWGREGKGALVVGVIDAPEYAENVVCAEAEYAYNLRKRIIPLRLEADYKPDGWLGPLCFNNLWYDFSKPEKFDEAWSKLNATLNELKRPGCDTCDKDWILIQITPKPNHLVLGPYRTLQQIFIKILA